MEMSITHTLLFTLVGIIHSLVFAMLIGILIQRFGIPFKKWMYASGMGILIGVVLSFVFTFMERSIFGHSLFLSMLTFMFSGFALGYFQAGVLKERFLKTKYWIVAVTVLYATTPVLSSSGIYGTDVGGIIVYFVLPILSALYLGLTVLKSMKWKPEGESA